MKRQNTEDTNRKYLCVKKQYQRCWRRNEGKSKGENRKWATVGMACGQMAGENSGRKKGGLSKGNVKKKKKKKKKKTAAKNMKTAASMDNR